MGLEGLDDLGVCLLAGVNGHVGLLVKHVVKAAAGGGEKLYNPEKLALGYSKRNPGR